jgi:hypothetical protein
MMYNSNLTTVLLRSGIYNLPSIFILLYKKHFYSLCKFKKESSALILPFLEGDHERATELPKEDRPQCI